MGLKIGVIGEPTKGKSASIVPNERLKIKGLNPEETIILSFSGKQLPVKGANTLYPRDKKITEGGRFVHVKDVKLVPQIINYISDKRPEIKHIVMEDAQYSMANEFMARAKESGYGKFTDIGVNFAAWMSAIESSRHDLYCFIIWHPEKNAAGEYQMKTIGKMVNDYLTPEGLLDLILYADCEKGSNSEMNYFFVTNNDGRYPARTPDEMFETLHIPNDLGFVVEKINSFYN